MNDMLVIGLLVGLERLPATLLATNHVLEVEEEKKSKHLNDRIMGLILVLVKPKVEVKKYCTLAFVCPGLPVWSNFSNQIDFFTT